MKPLFSEIIDHYEKCLEKFGDSYLGVDWPKFEDVGKRYKTMLDIINFDKNTNEKVSLLDFGCGAAHLLDYINENSISNIYYSGLDISEKFVSLSQSKYPNIDFFCGNILNSNFKIPEFDYIVMNGVFTEKRSLTQLQMWKYFTSVIKAVYNYSRKGIAFNVMSKNVDWEREDLFHLSIDKLSNFLCKDISRDFVVRNDYGLYEYTVYIYKNRK